MGDFVAGAGKRLVAGAVGRRVAAVRSGARTLVASRWAVWAAMALILLVGGYLRFSHLNWDEGTHIHPDERFLTMVSSAMALPDSLVQFFDSTQSPMSPYNKGFGFFVYGTLPIFIVRVVAEAAQNYNAGAQLWTVAPGIALNMTGYDGVHLVGRALSALFDLGCVGLLYLVGARIYRRRVGIVAAALYAGAVLPLQQSHFYTVDTFGTFFALLTFYWCVRVAKGGGWATYLALGATLGASIASRINLAPLAGIALLAAAIRVWDEWRGLRARAQGAREGGGVMVPLATLVQATLFRLVLLGAITIIVFRVAQPYAFGGTTVFDFSFADSWRNNMRQIQQLIGGEQDYPPGHQWANRTPFVFPWINMVYWGMGLPLGITAWAGWAVAAWQVVRALTLKVRVPHARAHLLPVAWIGGMFLWQGMQFVQSMRYLLPIYPILAMMSAWLPWELVVAAQRLRARERRRSAIVAEGSIPPWRERLALAAPDVAYGVMALVAAGTLLWGWGFTAIYRRPLSRIEASRWIYANIPEGSVLANEHWDDGLPFSIDGKMSFKPAGMYNGLSTSSDGQMQMYGEDTPEKRELVYQWLHEADYLVLSSNRLWGSIPRLPLRYPMTTEYYRLLFEGKLGFELAGRFTSFPTLFGIKFDDTWAEEAFSVYDHPEVRIYRKTAAYSDELVRGYFDPIDLENTVMYWPKQVSASPSGLYLSAQEKQVEQAGGTWSRMFDIDGLLNRSPWLAAVAWYLAIVVLGLAAFPLLFVALRSLPDHGWGLSKIAGMLALAWLSWIGPSLKVVSFTRGWIALCLAAIIGVSGWVAWRRRTALARFFKARLALVGVEEALFLVLFVAFLLVRAANPDLWHPARGGEKPMDFAYLNAVIRSTHFPPYDPWHAGGFLNYYYFGFVLVAALTKLTAIVPWIAYNLAVPTLFAMTGTGAFAVAFALADGDHDTEYPGEVGAYRGLRLGPLLAGVAATFFVAVIGNLGNVRLLAEQFAARAPASGGDGALSFLARVIGGAIAVIGGAARLDFPNDWWFWNASRVIPNTINEFPSFTFTYADLHAHMLALPLTLLALGAAVALVRHSAPAASRVPGDQEPSPWRVELAELLPLLLVGFTLGALRATNTWDFPTYALVAGAAIGVLEATRRGQILVPVAPDERLAFAFRAAVSWIWRLLIVLAVATVAFYPFSKNYATAYAGLQLWKEEKSRLSDFLIVHSFFLLMATIYLLSELAEQLRHDRLPRWLETGLPFVVGAGVLVLGAGAALGVHVWLVALPLAILATVLALGRDLPPVRRFALLLVALALAISMGVEVLRLKDDLGRMNTVFKFYLQAWTLFGVGAAVGLGTWAPRSLSWPLGWRRLAAGIAVLLFAGTMLYPPFAVRAKVRDRFSEEASPRGLDGMAYMDRAQYFENNRELKLVDDKAAILWVLREVTGSPVILEAQMPEYRWGSRFSIYTGLPAVQGWNWHQRQQRSVVPGVVVERRVAQVQEMYTTTDLARVRHLLDLYDVRFVIVGELERALYDAGGLAKFDQMVDQGYLSRVYRQGAVTIYEVSGRDVGALQQEPKLVGPQPLPTLTPGAQITLIPPTLETERVGGPATTISPEPGVEAVRPNPSDSPMPTPAPFVSPPQR